jgi:squalene-hopene/tetraprenyl-beta-curcumene cyclase
VKPDDPRVQAVRKWVAKNYDVKTHPGQGEAGLFYYYNTFAKALSALGNENGNDKFVDEKGVAHDWRKELIDELASRQREDGSWVNSENPKWMEGDSALVTGYALLALSYCKK